MTQDILLGIIHR